ncbi:MAG: GH1 family beta-glucosidase [Ilumatobacter sp.]
MTERDSIDFPSDFVWGAATAAYQIEGAAHIDGRGPSVWDQFSHTPGKVAHGHTGDVACDHYHRVAADVKLMADLGLDSYRFSISWPRVMPDGRTRKNPAGIAWYHRLVDLLLEHGIAPCPTLFHWDLPLGLEEFGGFRNRDAASWFADYAALMAQELGDRVTMWSTFNEPWCYAYLGHAAGIHAPGLTDSRAAVTVAHHQLLAHGLATEAMRAERHGLAIGIVINPTNVVAEGSPTADADEMRMIDGIHNRWWFDALLRGEYPDDVMHRYDHLAEAVRDGDDGIIAQPIEWIGINYYSDQLVRGTADRTTEALAQYPTVVGTTDAATREVHTDMGWPITPDGLTELLVRLDRDYPNLPPLYITENGCAYDDGVIDGRCADPRRIEYLDLHLRAVRDAIDEGIDVRGYFQWSLLDNFEWALGYDKRFGLVHVDFDTLERTPKDSARWYADVIRERAVPARDE